MPAATEAAVIYIVYHEPAFGSRSEGFTIERMSPWLLTVGLTALREQMDLEMTGEGRWTMRDGWKIYLPDYEFEEE